MIKRLAATNSQGRDNAAAPPTDPYAVLHSSFGWQVDEYFNIAEVCCRRWAQTGGAGRAIERIAIQAHQPGADTVFIPIPNCSGQPTH